LTIDPSNPIVLNAANKFMTKFPDTDQDTIAVKLTGSKIGIVNVYLTDVPVANPAGPISLLELVGTDPAKSALSVTVKKASPKVNPAADGMSSLAGVVGAGLSSLKAPKFDLDGANGPGIVIGGFVGAVALANVRNGADIHTGASPDPKKATSIVLGTVADGTDIVVAGPIKSLSAIAVGKGSIVAPSVGAITIKGKAKTKTAAAIPGDFRSNLTIAGTGLAPKVPALKSFKVAGAVSGSDIRVGVGGTIGDVGSVSVGSFIDSTLFAGYDGPTDGSMPFNLSSTVKSFIVTGKTNAFARSFVIATYFNTVSLASVDTTTNPTQFGFLYHGLLKSLTVRSTGFKFNPKGPVEQDMVASNFYVKKV
jgi:hypothetical protein